MQGQFGSLQTAMHEMHADIKGELSGMKADSSAIRTEFAYLRGRFDVLIWAVGSNAAATIAILGVLLRR